MNRLHRHYDKLARKASLNQALTITLMFAFYCSTGLFQVLYYFKQRDSFYLVIGPINILLGMVGILSGVQMIHAIVRRLVAESHGALPPSPAEN